MIEQGINHQQAVIVLQRVQHGVPIHAHQPNHKRKQQHHCQHRPYKRLYPIIDIPAIDYGFFLFLHGKSSFPRSCKMHIDSVCYYSKENTVSQGLRRIFITKKERRKPLLFC